MFDSNTLIMFFAASVLLALTPGPDILYVLTQSMLKGGASGVMVTLGLCTGLVVHTAAVAVGVAALFKASVMAFTVLKFVGAAYLLFLAWKSFSAPGGSLELQKSADLSSWYLYRRGVIMNITNPKVSIFFLAFLPQFSNPLKGSIPLQLALLGGMFIIAAFAVFSSISYLAGLIGTWFLKSKKAEKVLNWAAGSIFAVLAIKLALTRQ